MVPDGNEVPANNCEAVKCASFAVCINKVLDALVTLLDAKCCEGCLLYFLFVWVFWGICDS